MRNRKKYLEPEVSGHKPRPKEHVKINRSYWDKQAKDWTAAGKQAWAAKEPNWGIS